MSVADPSRAAQDALGAQLFDAARRDERPAPRWRRRRRRGLALLLGGVLGVAAAAGAVDLISVGEPLPDRTSPHPDYRPAAPGSPELVAQAPDRPLPWGVAVYTAANGEACALAGQVRGVSLGRLQNGRFREYERGTTGACGNVGQQSMVVDMLRIREPRPRSVLFGRTRASVSRLVVEAQGERHVVTPARGGGFVLVFDGLLRYEDLDLRAVDSRAPSPE